MKTPEIREAPVPVRAWDIHPSGQRIELRIPPRLYGYFQAISQRPLCVQLSNGQTIIVRAKP